MSVAAVMLVKDEADVIGYTLDHLATQVDAIFVLDNLSTDATPEILASFTGADLWWSTDDDPGYRQAEKTTSLARLAYEKGFDWIVPVDADELWRCPDPAIRLGDALDELPPFVVFAKAFLFDHKVTSQDPVDEPNPFRRIGWRFREPGKLPKVAVRASPEVAIGMGNHDAETFRGGGVVSSTGRALLVDDRAVVEHYTWRSEEQFVRKIRNGYRAYAAAPELDPGFGAHWRAFGDPDEEGFEDRVRGWFREWAYSESPETDPTIGYFPAPIG